MTSTRSILVGLLALPLVGLPTSAAAAETSDAPRTMTLDARLVGGPGCPFGQYEIRPGGDRRSAGVSLYSFAAKVSADPKSVLSTCAVGFTVNASPGWTFAPAGVWWQGDVDLGEDVTAELSATTYFTGAGGPDVEATPLEFTGRRAQDWIHYARFKELRFAPCGTPDFHVMATMYVNKSDASTRGVMRARNLMMSTNDLVWKKCA